MGIGQTGAAARRALPLVLALALNLVAVRCDSSGPSEQFQENVDIAVCDPSAGPFSPEVTNPYFPLVIGHQMTYSGTENGAAVELLLTVLPETLMVAGVPTRVLEERETVAAALTEISLNYFSQTTDGTVCYYGEDVDFYENGVVVSHDGSWRAGVAGALPGILMPAAPALGDAFRQEVAPGVAEDRAVITKVGETVVTPAGTFDQTIRFRETNPLDGDQSTKVYAQNVGMILDDVVRLSGQSP